MRRISRYAFVVAILIWLAYALGWIPGGLVVAAATSAGCLVVSYVCYRVLRGMSDAEQVAELRAMQQRDGMSDEELLSHVAVHHPNLDQFGESLASSISARENENSPHDEVRQAETVTLFPWVVWSDTDTAGAKQMSKTVFDKEPGALNSDEAGLLFEMLEAGRTKEGGMFMVVARSMAAGLEETGGLSMDPRDRDAYGRKRLPEVAREVGISKEVMAELGWDWPAAS